MTNNKYYEYWGFHNIWVWNPWKFHGNLKIAMDFSTEYWGFTNSVQNIENQSKSESHCIYIEAIVLQNKMQTIKF